MMSTHSIPQIDRKIKKGAIMSQKIKLSFGTSSTDEQGISSVVSSKNSSTDYPPSVVLKREISTTDYTTDDTTDKKLTRGAKINQYNRDHYDRLQLNVPKGGKEELDRACKELGMKSKVQLLEKGVKALRILKKQAESQGETLEKYMEEQKNV